MQYTTKSKTLEEFANLLVELEALTSLCWVTGCLPTGLKTRHMSFPRWLYFYSDPEFDKNNMMMSGEKLAFGSKHNLFGNTLDEDDPACHLSTNRFIEEAIKRFPKE